jgi:hypothetical protein
LGPKWEWSYQSYQNPKINGRERLNHPKNPDDGRGVLIYLTELGKEKETYQKTLF